MQSEGRGGLNVGKAVVAASFLRKHAEGGEGEPEQKGAGLS